MKKKTTSIILAFCMALLLLSGSGMNAVRVLAEEGADKTGALSEDSTGDVLTTGASVTELPEKVADLGSIRIYERKDFADAELGAIFGAEVETESWRELLADGYAIDGEKPALAIILTDHEDTLLQAAVEPDEEGKGAVPEKRMGDNDVKKILNHLRSAVGSGVPILWAVLSEASEEMPAASVYASVRAAEDSYGYHDIYGNYTYYREDDASDRSALAERIVLPLSGTKLFDAWREREGEPTYNDVVFYIFENGNDKAWGRTPETALKTGAGFTTRIRELYGKTLQNIPAGTRIVIEVSGEVQQSKSSQVIFNVLGGSNIPRDPSGAKIPVLIETYQYNGSNRAIIRGDYGPHDEGSSRITIGSPTTFKNIQIATSATGSYAMHNFFCLATSVVFDNTTFDARNGTGFTLSPSNNTWLEEYNVGDGNYVECSLTFKNGTYDGSTGVAYISALNTGSLWRSGENGGSILEGRMLREKVIVSEGAVCGSVYALTGKLPIASAEIIVEKGGVVKNLAVSNYTRSNMTHEADVFITVKGGMVNGQLHGLGQYSTLTGNVTYTVENSVLLGRPEEEYEYTDMFGDENTSIEGNFTFTMKNCLFAMLAGLNSPSSAYFGGFNANGKGDRKITIENSTVVFIPNKVLTSSDTALYFAPSGGALEGIYDLTMTSVLVDTSLMERQEIYFGNNGAEITEEYLTIGGESPEAGCVFYTGTVYLGGMDVTIGVVAEGEAKVKEPLNISVENTAFHAPFVFLAPLAESEEIESEGVLGSAVISMSSTVVGSGSGKIYTVEDGKVLPAPEIGMVVIAGGPVDGDLTVTLAKTRMAHLITVAAVVDPATLEPAEEETNPPETDENGEPVEIPEELPEYRTWVKGSYTINGCAAETFRTEGFDPEVNEIAFIDFISTEPEPEEPEPAVTPEQKEFPWLYVAIGGGAALLIALVLILVFSRKKGKKSSK